MRDDREPVRLEDRQERLVRLGDRHLLRREDRRLDVVDLAAEDEALAGQLADDPDELRQVGVLEREGDLVVPRSRGSYSTPVSNCVRPCVSAWPSPAAPAPGPRRAQRHPARASPEGQPPRRGAASAGSVRVHVAGAPAQLRERIDAAAALTRRRCRAARRRGRSFSSGSVRSVSYLRLGRQRGRAGAARLAPCAGEALLPRFRRPQTCPARLTPRGRRSRAPRA